MKYIKTTLGIILIAALLLSLKHNFLDKNKKIDVTDLRNATSEQVEATLGVTCDWDPSMSSRIFEYSHSGVSVKGDFAEGIGVVYWNGLPGGLRVEDSQYKLFNIVIGKSRVGMESAMTFVYDDKFEIGEDVEQELFGDRNEFPIFYCNWANNECIVVACEKSTGIVESVTYFNDAKKVTEKLKIRGKK